MCCGRPNSLTHLLPTRSSNTLAAQGIICRLLEAEAFVCHTCADCLCVMQVTVVGRVLDAAIQSESQALVLEVITRIEKVCKLTQCLHSRAGRVAV